MVFKVVTHFVLSVLVLQVLQVRGDRTAVLLNATELTKVTERYANLLSEYLNDLYYPFQNWDVNRRFYCGTMKVGSEITYSFHYFAINYESKHEIYCISEVIKILWAGDNDYVTRNSTHCNLARDQKWSECQKSVPVVQVVTVQSTENTPEQSEDTVKYLEDFKLTLQPTSCAASSVYGAQWLRNSTTSDSEKVFCDGGWTVIQRRFNGNESFNRTFEEYEQGFGLLEHEFWLGLTKIFKMTHLRGCRLRIDVWDFDDDHAFAEYSAFSISGKAKNYQLHIGGYSGTAGDGLRSLDGVEFNTGNNCGGWWSKDRYSANLNGKWGKSESSLYTLLWGAWKEYNLAVMATTMKLRCD